MGPAFQGFLTNEMTSQIENTLAVILYIFDKAFEELSSFAILSVQLGICTMFYDAVEQNILEEIKRSVLEEMVAHHVDKYLEAGKAIEAFNKIVLCDEDFLFFIVEFFSNEYCRCYRRPKKVHLFQYTSTALSVKKDAFVNPEASLWQEPLDGICSERSRKGSFERCK